MKPRQAKPGEMTRSKVFVYRVASTSNGITTVLHRSEDNFEARRVFEEHASAERARGGPAKIVMDQFAVEERETWCMRFNWSAPPKPPVNRNIPGTPLNILFVPFEIPQWPAARGWTYCANLAYADALRSLGHKVTVLNTLTIQYRELLRKKQTFDQVWTHVHFRHATDHYYREWLADAAPIRVGLAGESVFYTEQAKLESPWYAEQSKAFEDWRPFLTHCAFVNPADAEKARSKELRTTGWRQGVPERMVGQVVERPLSDRGVFCGAAYPPRDRWVWHPALRTLLAKPRPPEGPSFDGKFERAHAYVHAWMRGVGSFPDLALDLYHRRMSRLRRQAAGAFIRALGQGSCVVNLPSMVQAYSGRVVEGMAAGRPVLSWAPASEAGLFEPDREIIHYGDTPEELAEAIVRVQKDRAWANDVARVARLKVLAEHTVEKRTLGLLAWACE